VSYCGVLLVFGHELGAGADVALGAALVFGSALSYAVVYSGEVVKRLGSLRLTGLATSVACLCALQFLVLRPISAARGGAEVIWLSVLNATLCTFAPVLMVMMAIERIGSTLTAQTGMLGPMSTILMGVLLLGEPFTVGGGRHGAGAGRRGCWRAGDRQGDTHGSGYRRTLGAGVRGSKGLGRGCALAARA
jgi:drug/metabolite transporter (DMT)-like permease